MRSCPHCGLSNPDSNKWCENCGWELIVKESKEAGSPEGSNVEEYNTKTSGFIGSMGKTHYDSTYTFSEAGDVQKHVSGFGLLGSMGLVAYDDSSVKEKKAQAIPVEESRLYGSVGEKKYLHAVDEGSNKSVPVEVKLYGRVGSKEYGGKETISGKEQKIIRNDYNLIGRIGSVNYKADYKGESGESSVSISRDKNIDKQSTNIFGRSESRRKHVKNTFPALFSSNAIKIACSICAVIVLVISVMMFSAIGKGQQPENYYLSVDENNVHREDNVSFIKNQIIVVSRKGISKREMEGYFRAVNANIVGYVELMDTYQIQLNGNYSLSELSSIAESIEEDYRVESANVDVVWRSSASNYRDDPWSEDGTPSQWENGTFGNNWGVKAINAPYCWDNYDLGPIIVGVIDSMFDPQHEDIRFSLLANNAVFSSYSPEDEYDHNREHGTHVAGVIGARHNGIGISGVVENCYIIGFSKKGFSGAMDDFSAIASSVKSGARVINYSYGYDSEISDIMKWKDVPLSPARTDYQKYYVKASAQAEIALTRLLDNEYDFLLVVAAGNQPLYNSSLVNMEAKWGSVFTFISKPQIKNRIIVVGAVQNDGGSFSLAPYSFRGDRLDIMAPGTDIYSSIPTDDSGRKYAFMSGTSQAAPHVTGVCASVWAAAPELSGAEVKKIVVETADIPVKGDCPNMVNMKAAMERVKPIGGNNSHYAQDSEQQVVPSQQASESQKNTVLLMYAEMLHNGVLLTKNARGSTCVADHYYMFDMNNDGLEEMITYTSPAPLEWAFAVFTYKDGQVKQIADSVNTCDISEWSNSAVTVEISNGILHANATKATGEYEAGSDNYLFFNGETIYNYRTIDALPIPFGSNAFILIRTDSDYGVLIGSDKDYLSQLYLQKHPIVTPASTPVPTPTPSPSSKTVSNLTGDVIYLKIYRDKLTITDNGTIAEVDIMQPVLLEDSFIRSKNVGDYIDISEYGYGIERIEAKFDDQIILEGGCFLIKYSDKDWMVVSPGFVPLDYVTGSATVLFDRNSVSMDECSYVFGIGNGPEQLDNIEDYFERNGYYGPVSMLIHASLNSGVVISATIPYSP